MKLELKERQEEKSLLVVGSLMDVCRKRAGLHRKAGKLWINIPWSRLYVMSPALWISFLHYLFYTQTLPLLPPCSSRPLLPRTQTLQIIGALDLPIPQDSLNRD